MYAQRWFYVGLLGNDFNPKWVWPKQEDLPALGNMHRTVNPHPQGMLTPACAIY